MHTGCGLGRVGRHALGQSSPAVPGRPGEASLQGLACCHMIGSAAFSSHPVCCSVADMPLCVLIKRAGVSARLGVVCESGEASPQVGSSRAAVWGGGRGAGLGAEMELCSCRSKRVLGLG